MPTLSFKERRERERERKELKRVGRASAKSLTSGRAIVEDLARGRQMSESELERISAVVAVFREGGERLEEVRSRLKPSERALYRVVEEELRGEWMEYFDNLIAAIPAAQRFRPFAIDWDGWVAIGARAGMTEEQVVGALRVMAVLRDRA